MKFTEHRDSNVNVVKQYSQGKVKINANSFEKSLYLTQKTIYENWACQSIDQLNGEHLDQILSLQPEVIILGTGDKQIFPEPKLFAHCLAKGVGLEVMANDAACRTYNILTTEDREVVLALIL